mmetsp:Transcript_406/g.1017  ORF Transcript_406/g.1017 Transcript_406/m.1017 type:complete len:204 (+) Transcript_406:143-754(+)
MSHQNFATFSLSCRSRCGLNPGNSNLCRPPHVNRRPAVIMERSRATSTGISNTLRPADRWCTGVSEYRSGLWVLGWSCGFSPARRRSLASRRSRSGSVLFGCGVGSGLGGVGGRGGGSGARRANGSAKLRRTAVRRSAFSCSHAPTAGSFSFWRLGFGFASAAHVRSRNSIEARRAWCACVRRMERAIAVDDSIMSNICPFRL